ncbi:unnamed protein product [Ceratitis capitata]|uniref:(Mediterranean fruit fly) hypothetical protein n=1 Tax=Ceratitis capitata TaxID=7213 RepID=A0A811VEK5_CERCA|nr:unnamed protein product [Ceratitis capitata]
MKVCAFFLLALALATPAFGKTFTRCTLAQELLSLGVPKDQLAIWTCIAEHESSYRTGVVGPTNKMVPTIMPSSGRFSYNECNLSCDALLTDDISNSVTCARKIQKQQGWTAWSTWKYCNAHCNVPPFQCEKPSIMRGFPLNINRFASTNAWALHWYSLKSNVVALKLKLCDCGLKYIHTRTYEFNAEKEEEFLCGARSNNKGIARLSVQVLVVVGAFRLPSEAAVGVYLCILMHN